MFSGVIGEKRFKQLQTSIQNILVLKGGKWVNPLTQARPPPWWVLCFCTNGGTETCLKNWVSLFLFVIPLSFFNSSPKMSFQSFLNDLEFNIIGKSFWYKCHAIGQGAPGRMTFWIFRTLLQKIAKTTMLTVCLGKRHEKSEACPAPLSPFALFFSSLKGSLKGPINFHTWWGSQAQERPS